MTNQEVITQAVNDAKVIEAQTRTVLVNGVPTPVPPTVASLSALAGGELQNALNALLNDPAIRSHVLERTRTFAVTSVTAEGRGDILTLDSAVGSVISVTTSDTTLPLKKIANKEDFDYWYGEHYNATSAADSPTVWVPWDPSAAGLPQILLSPGAGSASLKLALVKKINQPVSMTSLPDDVHFLVVEDVKNRLTGGAYEFSFERDRKNVIARLARMVGSVSPMRLGPDERMGNARLSSMTGGSLGSFRDQEHTRPY